MTETKVVSFINMKGGVGKTTTTINIADTLVRELDKNVLVIDMDPQFNATQALFTKYKSIKIYEDLLKEGKTIANVVIESRGGGVTEEIKNYPAEEIVQKLHTTPNEKSLYLIPGDLELIAYESSRRGAEKILTTYINESVLEEFNIDYILIDTPATYSIYSQASLLASDYYIVPIAPDVFSTLGYSLLHKIMQKDLTLKGHNLQNLGIIFTLYKEDKIRRSAIQENFSDEPQFYNKLSEYEPIRTGKLSTLMLDMDYTKDEIINLATEFIEKVN